MANTQPAWIPKGVPVYSTTPGWPREGIKSGRGYAVNAIPATFRDAATEITWAGSGGYWKWVNKADVKAAKEPR